MSRKTVTQTDSLVQEKNHTESLFSLKAARKKLQLSVPPLFHPFVAQDLLLSLFWRVTDSVWIVQVWSLQRKLTQHSQRERNDPWLIMSKHPPSLYQALEMLASEKDDTSRRAVQYIYFFCWSPSFFGGSSVDFDGMFPELQKLEKFLSGSLLQSHEGSGFLLQILVGGQDNLSSFFCFPVAGVFEELFQSLLIQVLEDVGHGFLTWGGVEAIAVNGRADSQGSRHAGLPLDCPHHFQGMSRGSRRLGLVSWLPVGSR